MKLKFKARYHDDAPMDFEFEPEGTVIDVHPESVVESDIITVEPEAVYEGAAGGSSNPRRRIIPSRYVEPPKPRAPRGPLTQEEQDLLDERAAEGRRERWAEARALGLSPEDAFEHTFTRPRRGRSSGLRPSSPRGTKPLTEAEEMAAYDAGYEMASFYASKGMLGKMDPDDIFVRVIARDRRVPAKLNESHPQFWEYRGAVTDGIRDFAQNQKHGRSGGGFTKGEPVEVRQVWSSSPEGPLYRWFSGYAFHRIAPNGDVMVQATRGTFKGLETRHRARDVRRATAR